MRDDELYEWLYSHLTNGENVRIRDIREEFDESAVTYGRTTLEMWSSDGYIENADDGFVLVDEDGLAAELGRREDCEDAASGEQSRTRRGSSSTDHEPSPDTDGEFNQAAVVSVPSSYQRRFENAVKPPSDAHVVYLPDAIESVINAADDELRLAVPYFEEEGLNRVEVALEELADRNARIKVLTRGVMNPMSYESGRHDDVYALRELVERYHANTSTGAVDISDFQENIKVKEPDGGHRERLDKSVHLKAVIADTEMAYIGSGEIRGGSFYSNLEGGQLIRDSDQIRFWRDTFDFFFDEGDDISREYLKERLSERDFG